jgi:hypothetical protein
MRILGTTFIRVRPHRVLNLPKRFKVTARSASDRFYLTSAGMGLTPYALRKYYRPKRVAYA